MKENTSLSERAGGLPWSTTLVNLPALRYYGSKFRLAMVTCRAQTLINQTATEYLWISPSAWDGYAAQLQLFESI